MCGIQHKMLVLDIGFTELTSTEPLRAPIFYVIMSRIINRNKYMFGVRSEYTLSFLPICIVINIIPSLQKFTTLTTLDRHSKGILVNQLLQGQQIEIIVFPGSALNPWNWYIPQAHLYNLPLDGWLSNRLVCRI